MNVYLLICRLIGEGPKKRKKILKEKRIMVKEKFAAAVNERTASGLFSAMSAQDILRMLKKQEEGKI